MGSLLRLDEKGATSLSRNANGLIYRCNPSKSRLTTVDSAKEVFDGSSLIKYIMIRHVFACKPTSSRQAEFPKRIPKHPLNAADKHTQHHSKIPITTDAIRRTRHRRNAIRNRRPNLPIIRLVAVRHIRSSTRNLRDFDRVRPLLVST